MTHVMIYAPDGEPFEVLPHKVGDLVLNQGWSQTPPEPVAVVEEVPVQEQRARGRAKAEAEVYFAPKVPDEPTKEETPADD